MPLELEKRIKPKVFALLIEFMESSFLSIQYAYSLEEAFLMAKLEFEKENSKLGLAPLSSLLGAKVGLFVIKRFDDLVYEKPKIPRLPDLREVKKAFDEFSTPVMPVLPIPNNKSIVEKKPSLTAKNTLMKEIVEKKDFEKFNQNKNLFTKAERKYIEEKIKSNPQS